MREKLPFTGESAEIVIRSSAILKQSGGTEGERLKLEEGVGVLAGKARWQETPEGFTRFSL